MRQLAFALTGAAAVALGTLGPSTAAAQDATEKLSVHGYLTQGYAASDTLQTMGINSQGTTDYRRAAILLRHASSEKDNFVVQLAHRRLGDSPAMAFESDVKLDWGFYERRFGGSSWLRVGKSPIPLGIYNETRYVGQLLPFYRAPYSFYFEGSFTSETVDGLVASHTLFADSPWSLSATAFGGNYDMLEFSYAPTGTNGAMEYYVAKAKARNAAGAQLWLNTPLPGLRMGGGASRSTNSGGALRAPGTKESASGWNGGLDASFERFQLRGEYRTFVFDAADYAGYYAQTGVKLRQGLWLNGQMEGIDVILAASPSTGRPELDLDFNRDYAVGLSYAANQNVTLKLEAHQQQGYGYESYSNFMAEPPKARYVISSLSLAF